MTNREWVCAELFVILRSAKRVSKDATPLDPTPNKTTLPSFSGGPQTGRLR
jgi:hypothetical protein